MAWHPFRNFGLKVLAFSLGGLLWFTISGYEIERRISVPVSYRNVPASFEMTGEQTDRVTVQVRGDDNVVSALTEGAIRVVVDLEGSQPGANTIPLRTDQVATPPRVDVLQIDPGTVTVMMERAGQIMVPVRPTLEGRPAPGFAVTQVTADPQRVTIAGPESRLVGRIDVVTERIMVEGRNGRFTQEVAVGVNNPRLRVQSPRTVRVTVTIEPVTPDAGGASGEAVVAPESPSPGVSSDP